MSKYAVAFFVLLCTPPVQAQLLEVKSWEYDPALAAKKDGYFSAFRSGNVDSDRAALDQFFDKYYFARWTALEDLGEGQMVSAGTAQEGVQDLFKDFQAVTGNARTYLLDKSFQTLQKMAADPLAHPSARVNAVFAIGRLTLREPAARNAPPTLYAPTLPYLIAEYQKADTPQFIKLAALNGVVRHAGAGIEDETLKNETVPNFFLSIISAGRPGQNVNREEQDMKDWFRSVAMDGLAGLKSVGTGGKTINALVALMGDVSETLEIRTKAARTLGDLDYQAAATAGTNLNYQAYATVLITLMKTTCDEELQTVIQLRDKARVTMGSSGMGSSSMGSMSTSMPTAPGMEVDPPYASMTLEGKSDVAGAVQSIKSNVQNIVYGLRGNRHTGTATQGIQPMLPQDDAVANNITAMMTKGVVPLFKILDEGPPETELRARNAMMGSTGSTSAGYNATGRGRTPPPSGRTQAADEKVLNVNLLDIRNALQAFGTELDGIISGAGT